MTDSPDNNIRVSIRRAEFCDAEAIATCLASAFEPYRAAYTPGGFQDTVLDAKGVKERMAEMTILVAECETLGIVGTISFGHAASGEGHLRGMAVTPATLGSGIGGRLLVAAESALGQLNCKRLTLDTTAPLKRAKRFYARNGYEPTGVIRDFYGMPLFEYAKNLSSKEA